MDSDSTESTLSTENVPNFEYWNSDPIAVPSTSSASGNFRSAIAQETITREVLNSSSNDDILASSEISELPDLDDFDDAVINRFGF